MENFYGQFSPPVDKLISEYFEDGFIGSCIEVGACDGIIASNTYFFEKKGWHCISVEPNFWYFEKLKKNRKNAINCACGKFDLENVEFTIFELGDNQSAISSLVVDSRLEESHKHIIKDKISTRVSVKKLDTILEDIQFKQKLDFVSIDTEGTELDVLMGFSIDRWSPKLLIIENNFNDIEIENYMSNFGYKKDKRYEVNDFYIKK